MATKKTAKKTAPKPKARPGVTYNVQLSFDAATDEKLNYLCRRVAARQGGNPERLRSSIVRALIFAEADREQLRERQEQAMGR